MKKENNLIHRNNIQNEVIEYFELGDFNKIKQAHLFKHICDKVKYKLKGLAFKVLNLYSFNNAIEILEIENYIYSIILEIISNWKKFPNLPFVAYFWNTIKLKMINYINTINKKQFQFEENLTNKSLNLDNLKHNILLSNTENDSYRIYNLDVLKKIISAHEYEYLQSEMQNKKNNYYTQYQKNKIIRSINHKINLFQNY
ncbi:hypothetical protein [Mycoplasmopsis cricetuli]|uniref:hypothetical protein n=1 Tax=Mycoplasmopsis cricetuli TaxID=171283 RepID=UPI000472184C|nr:hypothetical protein [Mycoplasmopsis cricetuli]